MRKLSEDCTSALMLVTAGVTPTVSGSRRHSRDSNPFFFPNAAEDQISTDSLPGRPFRMTPSNGGQSLMCRRLRGRRLRPLLIFGLRRATDERFAREFGDGSPGEDFVEEEGRELFSHFVQQQAEAESPEAAQRLGLLTPSTYTNAELARIGRELRYIAQTLVDSPERQRVRQRASQVPFNIRYAEFKTLLRELFAAGGITRERIVVLFFFCSDVALCSLSSQGSDLCSQFLRWSLSFISESVCDWVRSHGGWTVVMSSRFSALTISVALAGVILVGYGVIKYVTSS